MKMKKLVILGLCLVVLIIIAVGFSQPSQTPQPDTPDSETPSVSPEVSVPETGPIIHLPQSHLSVINPTTSANWPIGSEQSISWQIDGALPVGAVLQLNLLGPTNINVKSFANVNTSGSYSFTIPTSGCWGQACRTLETGEYLVEVALFSRQPCYGPVCTTLYPPSQVLAKANSAGTVRITR